MRKSVRRPVAIFAAAAFLLCGAVSVAQTDESGWNRATYSSCVPAAMQSGATSQGAAAYCACTVRQLDRLPLAQREALSASSPELSQAADACRSLAQSTATQDDATATAWDRTTYQSCVPSAMQTGASEAGAQRYCGCVVAEFDQLPPAQREAMTTSSPEINLAAGYCRPLAQTGAAH